MNIKMKDNLANKQLNELSRTFKATLIEYGAMAQWFIALAALSEDLGSIPSNHMATNNCL